MNPSPIPREPIATARLVLRPTTIFDADRAFEIQSDWEVTRMLRRAPFPSARDAIGDWFADHAREWCAGEAFRFAVEHRGRVIGVTDIDEVAGAEGELGYWFERASWGHGYALEAAQAIVHFAVTRLGLRKLRSAHADDNPASGKVLLRLGFQPLDTLSWPSLSRGTEIPHQRYLLSSPRID